MPTTDTLAVFRYTGQDLRAVTIDGQPWFVAADVCRVLEHTNPTMALAGLDDDEKGLSNVETPGGTQAMAVVSEPGLYALIIRSRKAEAREFKRWITHTVLPAIRQTGSYAAEVERVMPHNFASALRELLQEVESHDETRAELAEALPRAEAWDAIASASGDYSVGDAAKILARDGIPTGPTRLFNQLHDIKWTFRGPDRAWRAYAERVEKGYLTEKASFHFHPGTGERVIDPPQVRVTVKGLERLRQRLHVGALQAVSA